MSLQAVESSKPCEIRYGEVITDNPLSVKVTDKFVLPMEALVIPQHLTDYSLMAHIGIGETEGDHKDSVITIYNGLKVGDRVILLRHQGGKQYIILDKI